MIRWLDVESDDIVAQALTLLKKAYLKMRSTNFEKKQ